ncbi:MAG: hypothetical protein ACFE9S_19385 [Candidatus Hermodarchaeota archaeon]
MATIEENIISTLKDSANISSLELIFYYIVLLELRKQKKKKLKQS